jgi:hypothetical protein
MSRIERLEDLEDGKSSKSKKCTAYEWSKTCEIKSELMLK